MQENILSVREIQEGDIPFIANYWDTASEDFLRSMGADKKLMPSREYFSQALAEQIQSPYEEKKSYAIIWCVNGLPCGHSNVNKIEFGNCAYMHFACVCYSTNANACRHNFQIQFC